MGLFLGFLDDLMDFNFNSARWLRIRPQCRRSKFSPWVRKIPLEKGMATHSSILAWEDPWTEELGGLQSMGSQESDTTERLHTHTLYVQPRKRIHVHTRGCLLTDFRRARADPNPGMAGRHPLC